MTIEKDSVIFKLLDTNNQNENTTGLGGAFQRLGRTIAEKASTPIPHKINRHIFYVNHYETLPSAILFKVSHALRNAATIDILDIEKKAAFSLACDYFNAEKFEECYSYLKYLLKNQVDFFKIGKHFISVTNSNITLKELYDNAPEVQKMFGIEVSKMICKIMSDENTK